MKEHLPQTPIAITTATSLKESSWSGFTGSYGAAISIAAAGSLELADSELDGNGASGFGGAIFAQGTLTLEGDVTFTGNSAEGGGGAVYSGKKLTVTGGTFSDNSANTGGAIEAWEDAALDGVAFTGNTATYGGAVRIGSGEVLIQNTAFAGNSAVQLGGAILNYAALTVGNTTFDGNAANDGGALCNFEDATATLKDVSFLTASDTISNYGTMSFQGTISLAGRLATNSAIDATGVSLVFDVSGYAAGNAAAIVGDLTQLTGVADYALAVTENQATGSYALAGNAAGFASSIALKCGDFESLALAVGGTTTCHNSVYTLGAAGGTLSAAVADYQTNASASALSWGGINDAESYTLELACGEKQLALEIATRGVELLGLANGDYTWQVRNSAEADNWQAGKAFSQTAAAAGPRELSAAGTDSTALFFAKADGAWDSDHLAQNTLTGETAQLSGKAKITDVFTGSGQASILLLEEPFRPVPEASAPGTALFLDDIFSAAPGAAKRARLSSIDTIIATSGDDIIDLTSSRYTLAGNVTILGGAGDDILWANSGNDILSGGAGDDTLHGGGGNDTFCFGEGWGHDTVGQLVTGSVTLWFAEGTLSNWNASTLTYTASDGSRVTVGGVSASAVELRFGAIGHEEEFASLSSAGAFD